MEKVAVCLLAVLANTVTGESTLAANPPGPFHVHNPGDHLPGTNQWSKVSSMLEEINLRYSVIDSATGLARQPKVTHYRVNMTDGVTLATTVINPYPYDAKKGAALVRSPYGPTSDQLAKVFIGKNGFAAVLQDDRGTFTSGGKYDVWRTAVSDGRSTMDWITKQEWSNGEVYTAGVSADGINEASQVIGAPPMLKGQWWMWTTASGHHFAFPGGAYRQDFVDGYFNILNPEIHFAGGRVIRELKENEGLSNWWYNLTVCEDDTKLDDPNCHWRQLKWPIVLSTGWWDIFQQSSIDAWNAMRRGSDASVRDKHVHVIAPLGHCFLSLGDHYPTLATAEKEAFHVSTLLAAEMFAGNFSGPTRSRLKRLNFYVMGGANYIGNWNYWTSLDAWPASSPKVYYLATTGLSSMVLSTTPPEQLCTAEYDYDPRSPAPMLGGNNLPVPHFMKIDHCGGVDQSTREARDDVITFDSETLSADMAVVGPIKAKLFVSSSANDTDFVVTLSDLSSNKSSLVRYGNLRMRWRESEITKSPNIVPGKVYEVDIKLASTAYVFPKGHRVRVSVSSAAYPYYNANSNTGKNENVEKVVPVVAHNVIYMGPQYPSQLVLPLVDMNDIPENRDFPGSKSSVPLPIVI